MARAREWDRSCQVGWQPNAWCDGATFQAIIKMLPCGEGALLFRSRSRPLLHVCSRSRCEARDSLLWGQQTYSEEVDEWVICF